MNLFKLLIPKDKSQEVIEVESFTVTWQIKKGWSDQVKTMHKVFISKKDAIEFNQQLIESAKFIGCWIDTELKRN